MFSKRPKFSKKAEHVLISSAYYIAPEVLSKIYTELCDLWTCSVIMCILLTGCPRFNGSIEEEIMKKKEETYDLKKYPLDVISEEAKDLLKGLLRKNTKKRLTVKAILEYKWFINDKTQSTLMMYNVKHRQLNKLIDNLMK